MGFSSAKSTLAFPDSVLRWPRRWEEASGRSKSGSSPHRDSPSAPDEKPSPFSLSKVSIFVLKSSKFLSSMQPMLFRRERRSLILSKLFRRCRLVRRVSFTPRQGKIHCGLTDCSSSPLRFTVSPLRSRQRFFRRRPVMSSSFSSLAKRSAGCTWVAPRSSKSSTMDFFSESTARQMGVWCLLSDLPPCSPPTSTLLTTSPPSPTLPPPTFTSAPMSSTNTRTPCQNAEISQNSDCKNILAVYSTYTLVTHVTVQIVCKYSTVRTQ